MPESMVNMHADRPRAGKVENVSAALPNDPQEARRAVALLRESGAAAIDFGKSRLGPQAMDAIAMDLSYLPAASFSFAGMRGGTRTFIPLFDRLRHFRYLKHLNLSGTGLDPSSGFDIRCGLQNNMGLKSLDLSDNDLRDRGVLQVGDAVPSTDLEEISFSRCGMTTMSLSGVIKMGKKLEKLNLSGNTFDDRFMSELSAELPGMPLKSLNLDHTEMTEAGAKSLLVALQHPDCKIADLSIEGNRVSEPLKRMIEKAIEPRRREEERARKVDAMKREASQTRTDFASLSEMRAAGALFPAVYSGVLFDRLETFARNGEYLSADDYLSADKNGTTLIAAAAEVQKLDHVFRQDFWQNAQSMEKVFKSLPEYDQAQLDGREGRPSFNVLKSKVTADTVRRLLAQRLQKKM